MNGAVLYKNVWLMKGSQAYELWQNAQKDPKTIGFLIKHMNELETKNNELMKRYGGK